ncbi:MAG: DegT/DnrJ/EryC1/StrS aminotransferase family protein [Bacteroidales bacterium]|nr:DegT/DnrJ/EryC1/StrS aminotransferase family protein [Bacteroidales bacterium]
MQLRDLKRQYEALKTSMDEAILNTVSSGSYILGDAVERLERRLAHYVRAKHCLSCASGTDALRLALMAWDIQEGDAVFVPSFTFFASAEAIVLQGATPIFVDVERESYNIDPADLERKIAQVERGGQSNPRAIMAVDLFGRPADYPLLREIAMEHNLLLLEDGAQGFGGGIGNERNCSFGHIAAVSFFPAKPLGCYGDGGAVFTDNDDWAAKIQSLRIHGKGADKYHNVRIGLNSRLDAVQAAVLQVKMDAFERFEQKRTDAIAQRYTDALKEIVRCPVMPRGTRSAWAQYTIRIPQRDKAMRMLAERGIPTAVYYPVPLHRQPAFAHVGAGMECPVADSLCEEVLSLPIHPYLLQEEQDIVIDAIKTICNKL